ncbi:MAG: hypothetical protein NZV14_07680 [Bryobacteraceae bacterium]|nr:hypothetical protein [Bryobacteraceae bacterium]MDW8378025.1 hypothetical protein [Bryobacterales bacterium]
MIQNPRKFTAGPDPFGRKWQVLFRWQQNAISIRHADAIDNKFELTADDGTTMDKVIAIRHTDALAVAKMLGREVTDSWLMRIAAEHILTMIETWEDAEPVLVTLSLEQVEEHARKLQAEFSAARS